ncbi:MAG: hypothetical protein QM472_08565 [Spirochaetota bacterium]|nr:hypothetical protein [Spirochaetota bacterium]HPV99328.1 hypothetical protein [Spirochaetota bacterium]
MLPFKNAAFLAVPLIIMTACSSVPSKFEIEPVKAPAGPLKPGQRIFIYESRGQKTRLLNGKEIIDDGAKVTLAGVRICDGKACKIVPGISLLPAVGIDDRTSYVLYNGVHYSTDRDGKLRQITPKPPDVPDFKKPPVLTEKDFFEFRYGELPKLIKITRGNYSGGKPVSLEQVVESAVKAGGNVVYLHTRVLQKEYWKTISSEKVGSHLGTDIYRIKKEKRAETIGYQTSIEINRCDDLMDEDKLSRPLAGYKAHERKSGETSEICEGKSTATVKDSDGFIEVYSCKSGRKDGSYARYYPGRKAVEVTGAYKEGLRNGEFRYFSENGMYNRTVEYESGRVTATLLEDALFSPSQRKIAKKRCDDIRDLEIRKKLGPHSFEYYHVDGNCERAGQVYYTARVNQCADGSWEKAEGGNKCAGHGGIQESRFTRLKEHTHGGKGGIGLSKEYYSDGRVHKITTSYGGNPPTAEITTYTYLSDGYEMTREFYRNGVKTVTDHYKNNSLIKRETHGKTN